MKSGHCGSKWSILPVSVLVLLGVTLAAAPRASAIDPCCQITNINLATGVVTARVNNTDQTFDFTLTNRTLTRQLHIGQPVYANLTSKQVSLDGQHPAGQIVSIGPQSMTGRQEPQVPAGGNAPRPQSGVVPPGTSSPQGQSPRLAFLRTIDPCSVATAAQLQTYAAGGLAKAFPISDRKGGDELTLSDPKVDKATCPPFHIWIDAKAHFKRTRGFPQFESKGHIQFDSVVIGVIVSTVPSSDPVTDATFVSAALCFTDIHVDDFNLKDVPNWIDDTYMRNKLNQDLAGKEKCADVSALIKVYLQAGNTIPPSAPAGMQANPREVPQLGGQL